CDQTAATDHFPRSLHDALPICKGVSTATPGRPNRCQMRIALRFPGVNFLRFAIQRLNNFVRSHSPKKVNTTTLVIMPNTVVKMRSEEHTSELQSRENLVCRLLL